MSITQIVKEFVQIDGITGFEANFAEFLSERLRNYCDTVDIKKNGSVVGMLRGAEPDKKTILLEAHLDRIGLCVSEILDGGFVKFKALGGVDERILLASEVIIRGKQDCFGIIGAIPPHLMSNSDKEDTSPKISDMLIDTGLAKEESEKLFSVGDPILLKSEFCELLDGRLSSAALDNRTGIATIFHCLDFLKGENIPVNVCIAFTVGEELGLQGARTLVQDNPPELVVVIDVTHGTTQDSDKSETSPLGSGASICRGPNLHYEITKKIIDIAKNKEIPFEVEVASGNTGTNAWAFQISAQGVPCALISIPLRYMHTTVETVATEDIESVSRLLYEIVSGGVCIA